MSNFLFPITKKISPPDPYEGERNVYEPSICMRQGCGLPRWHDPEKGETVLCQSHAEEVLSGQAKAPPLRPVRDYVSVGRKTFLVEELPDGELPIYDDEEDPL